MSYSKTLLVGSFIFDLAIKNDMEQFAEECEKSETLGNCKSCSDRYHQHRYRKPLEISPIMQCLEEIDGGNNDQI